MPRHARRLVAALRRHWRRGDAALAAFALAVALAVVAAAFPTRLACAPRVAPLAAGGLRVLLVADPQIEGDNRVRREGRYGHLNNVFNDWYYRFIVSAHLRSARYTHVAIVGDLFGDHQLGNYEFGDRLVRFNWMFSEPIARHGLPLITLAGNHDIGYSAEIGADDTVRRFESTFGATNRLVRTPSGLAIATLNAHYLETAHADAAATAAAAERHLRVLANETAPIILLLHVPLDKPDGAARCDERIIRRNDDGHVVFQNFLSEETSRRILDTVRPVFVINGHDHCGASYKHKVAPGTPGGYMVQEHTLPSIQGDYGGHVAVLTAHIDAATGDAVLSLSICPFLPTRYLILSLIFLAIFALVMLARLGVAVHQCRRDGWRLVGDDAGAGTGAGAEAGGDTDHDDDDERGADRIAADARVRRRVR